MSLIVIYAKKIKLQCDLQRLKCIEMNVKFAKPFVIYQNIDKVGQNFNEGLKITKFRGGLLKDTPFALILSLLTLLADHDKGQKKFFE